MRVWVSASAIASLLLLTAMERAAMALPTMIRLGYSDCGACHISPQGGGPLNTYGRGIDRAQSLRGGEYLPSNDTLTRLLTLGGRMTQDVRTVIQEQMNRTAGAPTQYRVRPRLMYRNATEIGGGFRVSATITAEN